MCSAGTRMYSRTWRRIRIFNATSLTRRATEYRNQPNDSWMTPFFDQHSLFNFRVEPKCRITLPVLCSPLKCDVFFSVEIAQWIKSLMIMLHRVSLKLNKCGSILLHLHVLLSRGRLITPGKVFFYGKLVSNNERYTFHFVETKLIHSRKKCSGKIFWANGVGKNMIVFHNKFIIFLILRVEYFIYFSH